MHAPRLGAFQRTSRDRMASCERYCAERWTGANRGMRCTPVIVALFTLAAAAQVPPGGAPNIDQVVFSSSGTNSDGDNWSMRITKPFIDHNGWDAADLQGAALVHILKVARDSLVANKLNERQEPSFTRVTLQSYSGEKIAFVHFRIRKNLEIGIAVNASFETVAPTVR